MPSRRSQAERREMTRAKLLASARDLFAERGYQGVVLDELAARAGLTRGALNHHFDGKEGLFLALFAQIQQEVAAQVEAAALAAPDPWSALRAGCHAFLEAGLDPTIRRVVLLDAPVVLGWDRWLAVDAEAGMASLKEGLEEAMRAGVLKRQPLDPLAHLLSGAMNELALWIARSDEPRIALREALAVLDSVLDGLRRPSGRGRSAGSRPDPWGLESTPAQDQPSLD